MMKMRMSRAASALLRALIARGHVDRNRILLTDAHSTAWRSLTFEGERHQLALRVTGVDSLEVASRICIGLEEAEFSFPGMFVADIAVASSPRRAPDGASDFMIESLTIVAD